MRQDSFETIEGDAGFTAKLYQDQDPESPRRDRDNLGIMLCDHRDYDLGDKSDIRIQDFESGAEIVAYLKEQGAVIILPLFLYDHSGITIRTAPFSCPWDSGQVGFIYVTRAQVLKEYSLKRLSRKALARAESVLQAEVREYDQYLTGDVWGYVIEDAEGEHIDSCWGFYGLDYAREEAGRALDYAVGSIQNCEKGAPA